MCTQIILAHAPCERGKNSGSDPKRTEPDGSALVCTGSKDCLRACLHAPSEPGWPHLLDLKEVVHIEHFALLLRPTSIAIALVGDHSDLSLDLSISHSHLDAVDALRVEFNSTFQRSPKTRRMYANRWSALVADQSDCNGGRPLCAFTSKRLQVHNLFVLTWSCYSCMKDIQISSCWGY